MRKKILLVLVFVFSLLIFSDRINANPEELVMIKNGASIRTKTETSEQGIKFTAKLNEKARDKEHGFYLVFGETTVEELVVAINNGDSPMIINGKEVFKVVVPGVTSENEYSVVLTGTPERGYLDGLTAIPFVKEGSAYNFSKAPLTRSIAEVAMNLKNADQPHQAYDAIIDCVSDVKRLVPDNEGNLRLTSGIIETDPLNLKKEFARDWNQKFGTNLNDFNAEEFYLEARKPLTAADEETNKNISQTNLFNFFSEKPHNHKWSWMLELLEDVGGENTSLINQLDALKYGGVHPQGHDLKNGRNISCSIANFFNRQNEGEKESLDFTNENNYARVPEINKNVIINPRNYRGLYRDNEGIGVPLPNEAPKGYRFRHYEVDGEIVNPGEYYIPKKDDVVFRPKFEAINYNIRFYDGATEIGTFKATYNIEVELIFAVPEKPGYLFLGWHDNSQLQGDPVVSLKKGNQGHLNFYASWEKEEVEVPADPNEEFAIAFELNEGAWPVSAATPGYTNRDEMIVDFLTDFYNFVKPAGVSLNDFMHGTGKTSGFDGLYNENETFVKLYDANVKGVDASKDKFINQPQYNKWVPLFDLMEEYTLLGDQSFWGSPYTGERRIKPFIQNTKPVGAWNHIPIEDVTAITKRIPETLKGSIPGVTIEVPQKYKPSSDDIILPIPEKTADNFLGWYDNAHFGGAVITKIEKGSSGNKTYYARWESMVVVDPDPDLQEYTVNFDTKGGNAIAPVKVLEGNKVSKPANPTKSGYSFVEWQLSGQAFNFNTDVRSNLTLIAVYKKDEVVEPGQEYTIKFNLNGGNFVSEGYKDKETLAKDFLTDLYAFVKPSENLTTFMHGAGKTGGFDGTWYSNEEYRAKIYDKGVKSGNNEFFLSHSSYQAKWKPFADFMVEFVEINPDQVGFFWNSPYTGQLRMKQYFTNVKPGGSWSDEDMSKIPAGLSATTIPDKYKADSNDIILPKPVKSNDPFIGWYPNTDYRGEPITKIIKGSTGNKVFYARYNSTEVLLTEPEKLAAAKVDLKVGFASGDSASSVTKNVTLPKSGLHGTTVTWATSDSSTINTAGNVVVKDKDVAVTLTATIKLGSMTETKKFTVTVKEKISVFTITYNLNGGKLDGFKNKTELGTAFLTDFRTFLGASDNVNTFIHGAGKTSGFDGTWYSNEEYRAKIFTTNVKTGNNAYFLSSSSYQAKWKPFADFMVTFVKVGNPDQDFWSSPFTGNLRMKQYFTDVKPGGAWSDEDMAKIPTGLSANVPYEYNENSPAITLPKVTRSGYTFEGWYTTANFSGSKVTSIAKGSTGNKVFYAKWSQPIYTITLNLNSGSLGKYSKANLTNAFLNDLYSFVKPSESLTVFKHGAGKSSGFNGTWYSNEEHRNKIYANNVKSGNNDYFLSSSLYQAKWKPFADFMTSFVKVGNADQEFWASSYTGNMRMWQYFRNVKPSAAWSDAEMAKTPGAINPRQYSGGSQAIILPPASRSGYTFDGWYTANTGGSKVTSIAANSTGNKTYYARWTKVVVPEPPVSTMPTIKVRYMTNNGAYVANRWITVKGVVVHSTAVSGVMAASWFNRWNNRTVQAAVHAFVDDKEIWQYLPWTMRGWHAGGSANNTHIGFEMCEPAGHYYSGSNMINYNVAANATYFRNIYNNSVNLTAYLLKRYGLSVTTTTVIGHSELAARGWGSSSADPMQWFPKHGKSMNTFRTDVRNALAKL